MAANRLDREPGNQLVTLLKGIERDLMELKGPQTLAKGNVDPVLRTSGATYDFAIPTSSSRTNGFLTFTPVLNGFGNGIIYDLFLDDNLNSIDLTADYLRLPTNASGQQTWSFSIHNQTYTNLPATNTPETYYMRLLWIGVQGSFALTLV